MTGEWKARTGQKIERLYAWIATEDDGGEGLVAHEAGDMMMPLIGADRARIEGARGYAEKVARLSGCPVALVCFESRLVLEQLVIPPHRPSEDA